MRAARSLRTRHYNWQRATGPPAGGEAAAPPPAAAPTPAATLLEVIGPFDPTQEKWLEYAERLVHYFIANDIASKRKQRAILLTTVGPGTYCLLKTLASPKKLDELTVTHLVDLASKHYNPKPSPIVKRFEFNCCSQQEGETIAVYVAELHKIAEHCDYGEVLSDMLRDRLVCGTNNKAIQRRLLLKADLTFADAMNMALAAEATERDSLCLTGAFADKNRATPVQTPPAPQTPVYRMDQRKQRNNAPKPSPFPPGKTSCYRCGGNHKPNTCPCKEFVCHFCKKKGHLAKVCRKRDTGLPRGVPNASR